MKIIVLGFALLAAACAVAEVLPSTEYLPPVQGISAVEPVDLGLSGGLADDGYRYKTVRRFRVRRRRDVNELPSAEYLPPVQQQVSIPQLPVQQFGSVSSIGVPSNEYLAPIAPVAPVAEIASGVLADDGYRYRTVKRYRARHRRDVNELPSAEYLPPVQQQVSFPQLPVQQLGSISSIGVPSNEYLAPIAPVAPVAQIASGVLADDGYRYKTVKRYRARHRRDVSELPSSEYLPPVQQHVSLSQQISIPQQLSIPQLPVQQLSSISSIGVPSNEYLAPIAPAAPVTQIASGVLADDGYRYRTVKRYRARHRRDVNELPSSEYLPPVQQHVSLPQQISIPQQLSIPQLPVQQLSSISSIGVPSNEYLAPIAPAAPVTQIASGVLADDGYRYRTVKRYRARHRRSVEPSVEYLPPVAQQIALPQVSIQQLPIQQFSAIPSTQYLAPIDVAPVTSNVLSGALADDGYRYKTVKKFKRRH